MPPKRTLSQANKDGGSSATSTTRLRLSESATNVSVPTPSISRKVKACAACRKQKIKCIMREGPPCQRCVERGLSCVLNKSLQTLIEERSEWKTTVIKDLDNMHTALQEVLGKLSLPGLPPLQTEGPESEVLPREYVMDKDDTGPSCDNSPSLSPHNDAVPHVPIESLYQITRLRALRSDDTEEQKASPPVGPHQHVTDFISNGVVSIEEAKRLVNFYLDRIDHFMYEICRGKYRDFDTLRRGSSLLLACICTVAALHDPKSNHLYTVCKREFQRLMAASMFDRRIDQDHLRAMCIGAYWLHDISWTLSGYAIRRATEANLSNNYYRLVNKGEEDASDNIRIWYVLYICDHHLSILYGRPSIVREDATIAGWKQLMTIPGFTESDKRMVSQMALLTIMSNVRELFGPDTGQPLPQAFAPQLLNYDRQIDQWMGYWTEELLSRMLFACAHSKLTGVEFHPHIGEFPTKGVILHHHLAKLHLHSYVFRGLKGASVPPYFEDSAAAAVLAATSTVEMLLSDDDIRASLVCIPHYLHSMIAFACVFLLKVTAQHNGIGINGKVVYELTNKAVEQFRATPVGKWHLVHMMAEGLEKLIASKTDHRPENQHAAPTDHVPQTPSTTALNGFYEDDPLGSGFDDFGFGNPSFLNIEPGELDFNFPGFGL